jgi:hypothetical protein
MLIPESVRIEFNGQKGQLVNSGKRPLKNEFFNTNPVEISAS